jgi:isoquinoline 1-oxidoreductase subunit alpha
MKTACNNMFLPTQTLSINGQTIRLENSPCDPQMPLLWFLRDTMHLTDTKYGCGIGVCGACTVLINGEAVRSCQKTIGSLQTTDCIFTVQHIPPAHPLKNYWKTQSIPQCGYCQTGALLACYAQSQKEKPASLNDTLNQHLCRCGSYQRSREVNSHLPI